MTRTLFLHVGWSKTGTSAIQSVLSNSTEQLYNQGLVYPKSLQWADGSHHHFSLAFNSKSGYVSKFTQEEALLKLTEEIEGAPNKDVLISSELSPFYFYHNKFNELVRKYFDRIKILFTIRRQSELIFSLFNQLVKDPNVGYRGTIFELFVRNINWMAFNREIEKWTNEVGRENIIVINYSNSVVADFLKALGLSLTGISSSQNLINSSVKPELLLLIQMLSSKNFDRVKYQFMCRRLIDKGDEIDIKFKKAILYRASEQRAIDDYYLVSNKNVADNYATKMLSDLEYPPYRDVYVFPFNLFEHYPHLYNKIFN